MWSQLSTKKRFIALPLLAILLVNAALAGTAVAQPQIWIANADLERDATLVGESVGVELELHNRGSGGAINVEVEANGSEIETERIQVEEDSTKKTVINVTFDEPGQYKIKANDKKAGVLTVTRMRVSSVTERNDGQTARLRAGNVSAGEPLTATVGDADNQSISLQQVTMAGPGSPFDRNVATYAPADAASFSVPEGDNSAVIGAVEMDAVSGVNTTSLRVAVDRDAIRENGLEAGTVGLYRKADGNYTALETTQVGTTETAIVYETSTDGGNQFVVGSLSPAFEVRSTNLGTNDASGGQQIALTTTVANTGPVAGEYVAEMRVDGVTVSEQTVTLRPEESKSITLTHVVTEKGEYQVGLGDESAGSVVLTSEAVSNTEQPSDAATESAGEAADGESLLDAEPSLPSLGSIGALELGIGASVALVGGGLILLLRR